MIEKITIWIAWLLPRRLAYWCAVRVHAHATLPPYGSQVVPELMAMDALRRWELDANTDPEHVRAHFEMGQSLMQECDALESATDALMWVTGHADFGDGGKYREGWLRVGQPALDKCLALPVSPEGNDAVEPVQVEDGGG